MSHDDLLDYYAAPGVFTTIDGFADQLESIPSDAVSMAKVVRGLLIHEGWPGASTSAQRSVEKQLHNAQALLSRASQLDNRTVSEARSPENRVVVNCRHFVTLFVALMRMNGVPCRARCGFATYFIPGKRLEHWTGEYWSHEEARWILVDVEISHQLREALKLDFNPSDIPRDRFLIPGDAWRMCTNGADPMTFGVGGTNNFGLVEIYGNLFLDLANLQKIELLPWEWYGMATDKNGMNDVDLMDTLAGISNRADATAFNDLRNILANDPRLRIPGDIVAKASISDRDLIENLSTVR